MIRYGYACKTIGVPGTAQTSLSLARAQPERVDAVVRHNLSALSKAIEYCADQEIFLYRISSDIIPLASHPDFPLDWRSCYAEELEKLGSRIRAAGIRVSMHPGQYTVLNSPRDEVVDRAVEELIFHADFLDAMELDGSSRLILHIGGVYGNKREAVDRFRFNVERLPCQVLQRLSLENDERMYAIDEVLALSGELGLPAVFDVFHHSLNPPSEGDMLFWLDQAGHGWKGQYGRQKIHYSQQMDGAKFGVHSRTIDASPFLEFHSSLQDRNLDVMLEVKDKNISAMKCINLTSRPLKVSRLTDEWARYKYLVMEHSPAGYRDISALFSGGRPDAGSFYRLAEEALGKDLVAGQAANAARHVWGYFKKQADQKETRSILADLDALEVDLKVLPRLKRKLLAMAERYESGYLLNSLYMYM